MEKLRGPYRWVIQMLLWGLNKKADKTDEEREMLRLAEAEAAAPSLQALESVISFLEHA